MPRRFQEMKRSANVRVVIQLRLLNRRTHSGPRGKVRDGVEFLPMKQQVDRAAVAKVHPMNRDVSRDPGHVRALDLGVVKVVEIVEDRDFMAGYKQLPDESLTNEPRAASNQNSERVIVMIKRTVSKA